VARHTYPLSLRKHTAWVGVRMRLWILITVTIKITAFLDVIPHNFEDISEEFAASTFRVFYPVAIQMGIYLNVCTAHTVLIK
jgi:hypothetical protein